MQSQTLADDLGAQILQEPLGFLLPYKILANWGEQVSLKSQRTKSSADVSAQESLYIFRF